MGRNRLASFGLRPIAVVLLLLAAAFFARSLRNDNAGSGAAADAATDRQGVRKSPVPEDERFTPRIRKAGRTEQPPQDSAITERLREFHEAEDLASILAQLESLAEEKRLSRISTLLREWCRTGELELVQWCLLEATESDESLALELAAEALSNPSDVMREIAASQLEEASGRRFETSSEARAWLAER